MAKTKRFFLSDIHLSSAELYRGRKYKSWYQPKKHDPRLLGFIDNHILKKKNNVKDVILLGDVFNTWVCPVHQDPPTYKSIFNANKHILDKFAEIADNRINLFYINGNHDFDANGSDLSKAIPGIIPIKQYRTGRIYAEHGHQYDVYNKPDWVTDPAYGRPIGYFISRLVATIGENGYGLLDLPGYIDDLLEAALTPQNIFSTIIEGLAERAGLTDDSKIEMPEKKPVTIAQLKTRFEKLSDVYTLGQLLGDLYHRRYLNAHADRLCQRYDYNIVVFGHTHNAMIDKDFFLVEDRIYANTGSWCKEKAYCVEVDKDPDSSRETTVSLHLVNPKGKIIDSKSKTEKV